MAFLRRIQWAIEPGHEAEKAAYCPGPGFWAVQAGCVPPPAHYPSRLLARSGAVAAMGFTVRTSALLPLNLGIVAMDQLGAAGCEVTAMATVALHEILVNAALHGNLEVCLGQLGSWRDLALRERLIAAALRDPAKAARLVTLAMGWNQGSVIAVVIDEGHGYHPADRITGAALESGRRAVTGRGLMMARAAGQVDVLRGGRCTRLIFPCQLQPNGPSAAQLFKPGSGE